eukprot:9473594-Pyramimonas_sp.AAC.1
MQAELMGSLQLVLTDPSRPVGSELRLDVQLPCALVIVGPSFRSTPAPTDPSESESNRGGNDGPVSLGAVPRSDG